MKLLLIITSIIVVLVLGASIYFKYRLNNVIDKRDLKNAIDTEVSKLSTNRPPSSLVVGVYKDKEIFFNAYGSDNPDSSTIFQIASLSKLFTSALLVILDQGGVLAMDSTLEELIGDKYDLSSDAKQVTLYQLATHTSGFPRVPKVLMDIIEKSAGKGNELDNPYSYIELEDVINYLSTTEGKQKPGKFKYSNYGMGLLGHILEIVTDKSLETLAQEKLLIPLSMPDTSITLNAKVKESLAQGYSANSHKAKLWTFNALGGAGAFNSTASDLMQFVIASIDGETPISKTLMTMQRPTNEKSIGWMQPGFIEKFFGNKTTVWHNGMVGGYGSYVAIDRETESGVVILSNKAIDMTMLGIMLVRQVRTQSWK